MRHLTTSVIVAASLFLGLPAAALASASSDRVEDFVSVVAVARTDQFPLTSLMRAECDFVHHVRRPDGSAIETMVCQLSDEPVMVPEFQGSPPQTAFIDVGGPCVWSSDYWWTTAGVPVYAESYRFVVTPEGRVHATSHYPAAPLNCQ